LGQVLFTIKFYTYYTSC